MTTPDETSLFDPFLAMVHRGIEIISQTYAELGDDLIDKKVDRWLKGDSEPVIATPQFDPPADPRFTDDNLGL